MDQGLEIGAPYRQLLVADADGPAIEAFHMGQPDDIRPVNTAEAGRSQHGLHVRHGGQDHVPPAGGDDVTEILFCFYELDVAEGDVMITKPAADEHGAAFRM